MNALSVIGVSSTRPARTVLGHLSAIVILLNGALEDRPRARVLRRQALEVPVQVLDDLVLGLGDEAEAPAVADRAGHRARGRDG